VFLGVSAPRRVEPGSVFSARFVVYIEVLEERVRQQLKELGGEEAQSALGIAPDRAARWKVDPGHCAAGGRAPYQRAPAGGVVRVERP
jgi:hypothetical protein